MNDVAVYDYDAIYKENCLKQRWVRKSSLRGQENIAKADNLKKSTISLL